MKTNSSNGWSGYQIAIKLQGVKKQVISHVLTQVQPNLPKSMRYLHVCVTCAHVRVCVCSWLQQLPYTEAVVKEALRLLPPGSLATRSTEQQGYQLTPEVGCSRRDDDQDAVHHQG